MSRKITGYVPGGLQARELPSAIQPGEIAVHVVGRLNTMGEILTQAACLRSAGLASRASGYGKAKFQDIKGDYSGTNKIAAAHRALFALHLDGQNAADIAPVLTRPRLRQVIIAPQARTDLVSRAVNYADQLLENAISRQVFALFQSTLTRQDAGRPVEKNLLVETSIRLQRLLHHGFDQAADAFRRAQRTRGWQEFRPGVGPPPLAGATNEEIDTFLDTAFGGGMKVHVAGPTHFGDLPERILEISQEINDRATPAVSVPTELDGQIAAVEAAIDKAL